MDKHVSLNEQDNGEKRNFIDIKYDQYSYQNDQEDDFGDYGVESANEEEVKIGTSRQITKNIIPGKRPILKSQHAAVMNRSEFQDQVIDKVSIDDPITIMNLNKSLQNNSQENDDSFDHGNLEDSS